MSAATLSGSATSSRTDRKFSNASSISRGNSPKGRSPAVESPKELRRPPSRPHLARQQSRQKLRQQHTQSSKWAHLPSQVRWYMNYHRENLTHHHYSLKCDTSDFLKTTFLEIALSYEPLLYAITAFSAYHHALTKPDGQLQDFLGYYNTSVSLLRESLAKNPRHTLATVLTILQLATFEVSGRARCPTTFCRANKFTRSFSETGSICQCTKEQHTRSSQSSSHQKR